MRRLGKTGLIHHVFHQLATAKKIACIYIDIFSTSSLKGFTNQLATAVYNRFPGKTIVQETIVEACTEILKQEEVTFYQFRSLLTATQWQLLTAIAKETKVYKPHSSSFIKKYQLGTSSLVTRTMESLLNKEMVYYNSRIKEHYYAVYDKFLMRWLQ